MTPSLLFVLAPAAALPSEACTRHDLEAAQRQGPRGGFALRLFSQGRNAIDELALLPLDGRLGGDVRSLGNGCQVICDAVIPHFEPQHHWLGVYASSDETVDRFTCLDRLPLSEANNETCWFYPTHDGTYLSWERGLRLWLMPGNVVAPEQTAQRQPYDRGRLAVLWSLLGDDASLSCVGLTYDAQRIDWPLQSIRPEAAATWSRFRVDSQAEVSPLVEDARTVFAESPQSGGD